ncbi:MAG: hypothetical protein U5L45_17980 [Saprospiraceae bacterium]|nr:hypothetical protein [Saprospiraceae bacterium]
MSKKPENQSAKGSLLSNTFSVHQKLLMLAVSLCLITACTKTDIANFDGVQLSPTIAVPLAKVNFIFKDFIKSDSLIKVGADSSVQIVYAQDSIASYSVADIAGKATGNVAVSLNRNISVSDLAIAPFTTTKSVKLSDVVNGFSNPAVKAGFTANYGRSAPLAAFNETSNTTSNLDDLTDFTTLTLASGVWVLTVQNQFPFSVQNLKIDILDRGNGNTVLTTLSFASIASGASATETADLAGKTLSNQLAYRLPNLSSSGTGGVPVAINPDATLNVQVKSQNFKVKSGRFKIVETPLATESIIANVATSNADQKLKEITIKNAVANYTITTPAGISLQLDLTFPSIKMNGAAVTRRINVTSATTTGSITFTNAVGDLATIAAQPYNQLPVEVKAVILPSPTFVTVAAGANITIATSFGAFDLGGAKGQFGNFNISIPVTKKNFGFDFSFLSSTSQKLLFDNPSIRLRYTNSFGIPIKANLVASATGLLGGTQALNAPVIGISYPQIAQIGQTVTNNFSINKTNSNIVPFLSILPKTISYSGDVAISSTNANEVNFFTADSKINLGLDVLLPLKFSTENLILRDTVVADFASNSANLKYLESASLRINHNNGFPMKTSLDLLVLKGGVATNVVTNFSIPSATVNSDGRVTAAQVGVQDLVLTNAQLQAILGAEKLIIVGRIQTPNNGTGQAAFYSNYAFEIGLGMQVKVKN